MNSRPGLEFPAMGEDPVETRIDAFYGGRFHLVQPARVGYRSGLDALLLAATVGKTAEGRLADVGAGAGAVGFAAATRAKALEATLIEKEPIMTRCAIDGLAIGANEHLANRIDVVEADIFSFRRLYPDVSFDHVLTNPPFYAQTDRPSPDPLRRAALSVPSPDFLIDWFRAALSILRDGGRFSALVPPQVLPDVLPVLKGRIGGPCVTPFQRTVKDPAFRLVLTGRKGSRAPLSIAPSRFLFEASGEESVSSREIASGTAFFGWP